MKAAILCIGDELLLGQVLDTNSHWLSQKLTEIGVEVIQRKIIGDNEQLIFDSIAQFSDFDILLITGGLGPTKDDKTKEVLCKYFDVKLKIDEKTLQNVMGRMKIFLSVDASEEIVKLNLKQAEIPENSIALENKMGTAPGILINNNNQILISLPGVPFEMKGVFENEIKPIILNKVSKKFNFKSFIVSGIPESSLSVKLNDFENSLPPDMHLAYLPSRGYIILRLNTTDNLNKIEFEKKFNLLKELCNEYWICDGDNAIESLNKLLKEKGLKIATVESCTAGALSSEICNVPGASTIFLGSLVPYSIAQKISLLHIEASFFDTHEAVSEACVLEMCNKGKNIFKSDLCISISGQLGPISDSENVEVGSVWMAFVDENNKTYTKKIHARWDRDTNKNYTIGIAIVWMLQILNKKISNS